MSNHNRQDVERKTSEPSGPRTWQQRYGAVLLMAGFGVLLIVMILMQKSM